MRKTEIEIAADCIKYCKKDLQRFEECLFRAEMGNLPNKPSEMTIRAWQSKAKELREILDMREDEPIML